MGLSGQAQHPSPRVRPTARLIVLDKAGRMLLFKFEDHTVFDPNDPRGADRPAVVWATPGGGVDEGETYEEAAHRELREETGLCTDELGPCLHDEENLLYFDGTPVLLLQRYFLVRVPATTISLDGLNPLEQSVYRDHRWWTLAELESTTEMVFPTDLPAIMRRALQMR